MGRWSGGWKGCEIGECVGGGRVGVGVGVGDGDGDGKRCG